MGEEKRLQLFDVWIAHYPSHVSIQSNGDVLARLLAQQIPSKRMVVLAHSMGGLVTAAAYRTNSGLAFDTIVALGTPWRGSPVPGMWLWLQSSAFVCGTTTWADGYLVYGFTRTEGAKGLSDAETGYLRSVLRSSIDALAPRITAVGGNIRSAHFPSTQADYDFYSYTDCALKDLGHAFTDGVVPGTSVTAEGQIRDAAIIAGLDHSQLLSEKGQLDPLRIAADRFLSYLDGHAPVSSVRVSPGTLSLQPSQEADLTADLFDATNSALPRRAVLWTSSDSSVASVNATTGRVKAQRAGGPVSITATREGRSGSAQVVVGAPSQVASVTVSPSTASIAVGGTQQFTATLRDVSGAALTGRTVAWTTSNQAAISLSQTGLATGLAGSAQAVTITAQSEGKSGSAQLTVTAPPASGGVRSIAVGYDHTCAVGETFVVSCWGNNLLAAIGQPWPTVSNSSLPRPLSTSLRFTRVGAGIWRSCALDMTGYPFCWGPESDASTGLPSPVPSAVPQSPRFASLAQGYTFSCGTVANSDTYCWGSLSGVALPQTPGRVPSPVLFSEVSAGTGAICAIDASGTAYCWGSNVNGQFGDGRSGNVSIVALPVVTGEKFKSISVGGYMTCGVSLAGAAFCWGRQNSGELGTGDDVPFRLAPTRVAGSLVFSSAAAGGEHACALTPSGQAFCWGNNDYGQLGNGAGGNRATPVAVAGGLAFRSLSAGGYHTCGITIGGQAYCWGNNSEGQLGDGSYSARIVPVLVRLQ